MACEQPRVGSHDSIGSQYFRRIFARCRRRPDYPLDRKRNGGISGRSVGGTPSGKLEEFRREGDHRLSLSASGCVQRSTAVIINIHGGPEGQSRPGFLGRSNFFLNELGVAILYPNVRGSDGFGKTFLKLDNGLKRLDSVRDIGALLDWIAKQPDLDPQRIMVTGGSYGGYMTLACAVEYNDRIRCSLESSVFPTLERFSATRNPIGAICDEPSMEMNVSRKSPSSLIAWPR